MHLLYGALLVLYEPVRITLGVLVVHLYTYAPPGLAAEPRSSEGPLFSSQCPTGTIMLTLFIFDGVELTGFKREANAFLLA